jgi:hypothetical protein
VLQDLGGDDPVERPVGERQPGGIAPGGGTAARRRDVAGTVQRRRHGGDVLQLGLVVVEGDHPGTAAQRLERVPPCAAAQVEQQVPRREPETVVVDGQHQATRRWVADASAERAWASRRMRYCSTVRSAVCRHDH